LPPIVPKCIASDIAHWSCIAAGRRFAKIVCGKKPGRTSAEEITIFDSTGMALQDAASAALA
jgi:ornithine cyclodeaminase/alanine dehydrogenase-like protein (mu-crystallin family)